MIHDFFHFFRMTISQKHEVQFEVSKKMATVYDVAGDSERFCLPSEGSRRSLVVFVSLVAFHGRQRER